MDDCDLGFGHLDNCHLDDGDLDDGDVE
jgi:hypothetical protein